MTSDGSAYPRFKRYLGSSSWCFVDVRGLAVELPWVGLRDALEVCLLLRDGDEGR
jgi:hypothetical protein